MRFDRRDVLSHVDLTISKGEFVAITGPNGGGKTTLLRVLLKLLKPTSGKVRYISGGHDVKSLHIGYLPQKNMIDTRFPISVRETVWSGLLTGYFGGIADEIVMRITDAVNGFPSILLTLVIISLLGSGRQNVIISLGIVFVPSYVRMVRSQYLKLRDADYIRRARLLGVKDFRILFVHILPNIFSVFWVSVMIGFNNAILAESGMSYLGIGVQPPEASLGNMLSDAQGYLQAAPWYALFVGMSIVWVVLGFSLFGEGIRRGKISE